MLGIYRRHELHSQLPGRQQATFAGSNGVALLDDRHQEAEVLDEVRQDLYLAFRMGLGIVHIGDEIVHRLEPDLVDHEDFACFRHGFSGLRAQKNPSHFPARAKKESETLPA